MNVKLRDSRPALLTVNVGSSTLKLGSFALHDPTQAHFRATIELASGIVHGTGSIPPSLADLPPYTSLQEIAARVLRDLLNEGRHLAACVHRVTHGGRKLLQPRLIDDALMLELEALEALCPLHQPPPLEVIQHMRHLCPDLPQIAVFDTAFHHRQSTLATTYALPAAVRNLGVRSYGFQGIACQHVLRELQTRDPTLATGKIVIAHLGSSTTMTAIAHGRSVASSTGFSTLGGLPMSTRSGAVDPGALLFLMEQGWSRSRLTDLLYHQSGLLGLSDISSDMRTLLTHDSSAARFAVDYFCYRAARELGSLSMALEGIDTLVFTAGIGENQPEVRRRIIERLVWLGALLDTRANEANAYSISSAGSKIRIVVIAADEQRELCYQSHDLLAAHHAEWS